MNYTGEDIYNTFFDYRDAEIATDFLDMSAEYVLEIFEEVTDTKVDEEDIDNFFEACESFFQILDTLYTRSQRLVDFGDDYTSFLQYQYEECYI